MAQNLVDELRLTVFPVVLGEGGRVFDAMPDKATLRLTAGAPLGETLVHLVYEVVSTDRMRALSLRDSHDS